MAPASWAGSLGQRGGAGAMTALSSRPGLGELRTPVWAQVSAFPLLGSQSSKWLCHVGRPEGSSASTAFLRDSVGGRPPQTCHVSCCILKTDRLPPISHPPVLSALSQRRPGSPIWAGCSLSGGCGFTQRRGFYGSLREEDGTECLAVLFITKLRGRGKREWLFSMSAPPPPPPRVPLCARLIWTFYPFPRCWWVCRAHTALWRCAPSLLLTAG